MSIWRYHDLGNRPEFAAITNPANISVTDLSAFLIGNLQQEEFSNVRITNSTDLTLNMTSAEDPNATIRTVPAKFVEMTYQARFASEDARNYRYSNLISNPPERGQEQTLTGIRISYEDPDATTLSGNSPAPVQYIFDSLNVHYRFIFIRVFWYYYILFTIYSRAYCKLCRMRVSPSRH